MQEAINQAKNNEVFFVGYTEEDLIVHDVDVIARGNKMSVPAVLAIAQEADVVIHNHPSGHLEPSDPDISIASHLDSFNVAFYIIDNAVQDIYIVVEPFPKKDLIPLKSRDLEHLLDPDGPIAKHLNGYENRPQQIEMIDAVCTSFNDNKITTIEAGTGTGKTMAYLLPAVFWALQNKERIVISTNTINLQEQLVKKDLPLLRKAIDKDFNATLVKGRSNYVCLRKIDDLESEFDLHLDDESEQEELKQLIEWTKNSGDGSKADLNYIPRSQVWEKLAAESDTCTRSKCRHFRECFVNKARRKASRAHILVVNHHLLFADLALKHELSSVNEPAVLPPYHRIVLDEAHHIEDVATNYFGNRVTRAGLIRSFNKLSREKKGKQKGHIHSLRHKLLQKKSIIPKDIYQKITQDINKKIIPDITSLQNQTDEVMDTFFEILKNHATDDRSIETKIRLLPHIQEQLFNSTGMADIFHDFIQSLKLLSERIYKLITLVLSAESHDTEDWSYLTIELKAQADRILNAADVINDIVFNYDDNYIRWIEARVGYRGKNIIRFQSSPLDISDMMKEAVYDEFGSIVMTSATLTVDNKFDFFDNRVGLNKLNSNRRKKLILPAPFDYENQVIMCLPMDVPDPRHASFSMEIGKLIFKSLTISEGRAFVLFTSYSLLNIVYNNLAESLEMIGITALKQGSENRHELLRRFRNEKSSVLFATDSFWEGVDVWGDALESVIITKLPFKVPNEPIIEARYEAIEKEGGNPFMDFAVPLAVIKLKQGFGRLVRRKTDRGSVLIFDNRIVKKNYGKRFLNSLPQCNTVMGSKDQVFAELKKFFS